MVKWTTPAGFLFTATAAVSTSVAVVATGSNITFSLLTGSLPLGLSFSNTGTIYGTVNNVLYDISNTFCVRAKDDNGVKDRTFRIDITGNTAPVWDTEEGYLPIGEGGKKYALNNQWVNFQLRTHDLSGSTINYSLTSGDLPPGLMLSSNGIISGFIKDKLTFDSLGLSPQSYDTGEFDAFGFDPILTFAGNQVVVQLVSQPKTYQFGITVSDNVLTATRFFNITVINEDMFRADNVYLNYNDSILSTDSIRANASYLQIPKFLNGSDLGIVRADNNVDLDVSTYVIDPLVGEVTYSIINGPTEYTRLPNGLTLDSEKGHIYGYISYQPAYTKNYNFTIAATKLNYKTTSTIEVINTFTLKVVGNVFSSIEWITDGDLGNIDANVVSELYVKARELSGNFNIKYQISDGSLPNGLELAQDGTIIGRADFNPGNFTFTVLAGDVYGLSSISRTFKLTVSIINLVPTTQIYVKPFLKSSDRTLYQNFINDSYIFDPSLIYRYFDSNFGIQKDIKMFLEYGIQLVDLKYYATALELNFYRKNLYFGDLKIAEARNDAGDIIYDVVYLDIIDTLSSNTSNTPLVIHDNSGKSFYPASIPNMKTRLETIQLTTATITTNEYNLPLFMRTPQNSSYSPANYIPVAVLCYALPGYGIKIANRIRRSEFDFKKFNFEIDRIIIEENATPELPNTVGPNVVPVALKGRTAKYLLINRKSISDGIRLN